MSRAAIYVRVSSVEQSTADHASLEVQETACRAYIEQRGWSLVAREIDTESGLKVSRAGYQRVLDLARRRAIDAVVVFRADRWGRNAGEVLVRAEEIRPLGVELHSTREDLSSFLMLGMSAVLAQEESRRLSERVGPAKRLKASQGYWLGHAPFGTVNEHGVLGPGPLFDLVRLAFELAAEGTASREIHRRLNAALAPRVLHLTTVRKLLRNPAYVGRVVWDDVDAPALWAPMIDPALFAAAGARLQRRYRERAPLSPSYPFWIVGLAFCGRCGARMHPKVHVRRWGTRYAYLVCGRENTAASTRGCRGDHFLLEDVQAFVVAEISRLQIDADSIERFLARLAARQEETDAAWAKRLASLRAERERLAGRLQTAKGAHLDAPKTFTIADVRQVEQAVRDNLQAIDRELARPAPAPEMDLDAVRRFYTDRAWLSVRETDPAAFRAFLQHFIERVEVIERGVYRVAWAPVMEGAIPAST